MGHIVGLTDDFVPGFCVDEVGVGYIGERHLLGMKEVKDDDFESPVGVLAEGIEDLVGLIE